MEEVTARARLVDSAANPPSSGFTLTLPRGEIEEALRAEDGEAELMLDVIRSSNGDEERRQVAVAWDRADLERLVRETSGGRVPLVIDEQSLEAAFDADVEAHGLREAAATLTIAIAAGTGATGAQAAVDQLGGSPVRAAPDAYTAVENVRAQSPTSGDPYAGIENVRAERTAPEAAPDPYAAIENVRAQSPTSGDPYAGIENVRAERTAPEAAPDPYAAIENVRAESTTSDDPYAGIEQVRADRTAPEAGSGGEGITISAPSPIQAAGLAGAAALSIAGAAFAIRKRRAGLA